MNPAPDEQLDRAISDTLRDAVRMLARRHHFSAAESLVAHDVALGLCRKEMAARRARSERTIQSQIRAVLRKTGLRHTGDLRARILQAALALTLRRPEEWTTAQRRIPLAQSGGRDRSTRCRTLNTGSQGGPAPRESLSETKQRRTGERNADFV
jgi:DNA-binding CsgD family transcriptional regulator